jgi:glycosyltransferase involved in cell wall biosynthesis
MTYSIVIATHNRAHDLRQTLDSLAHLRTPDDWEVLLVDNNSADDTRDVVTSRAKTFPAPLHYLFEAQPGRSPALNTGIRAARGRIIVTTDDDVRVPPDWLDQAGAALDALGCDYVGGRVLPIWNGPRPAWMPERSGKHWAVIALLDYGPEPIELGARMPLGVNMAFRRSVFERAGLWDPRIGRRAGTLLGQEVREWCVRARTVGLRGCYAPGMVVHHVIPAARLTKQYFRRWYYWRGVSRAMLFAQCGLDPETPQRTTLDFARVPQVFGVPRYLYRKALVTMGRWVRDLLRRDTVASFERELWLSFLAGFMRQRWNKVAQNRTALTDFQTRSSPPEPVTPRVFPVEPMDDLRASRLRTPVQP